MELRRQRGIVTVLLFPLKDGSGIEVSGVTGITPQISTWSQGSTAAPTTLTNIAGGLASISNGRVYWSSLTADEMAADYIYFVASPTSGSARRFDILINCTAVASVTETSTTTGVTSSVAIDWGRVINQATNVNLQLTKIATVSVPVALNWSSITGGSTSQNLSGTTVATVTDLSTTAGESFLAQNLASPGRGDSRNIRNALRLLRNRRALTTGAMNTATLTSYQEDDTTVAWTAIVSTASATGLTDINP